MWGPATPLIFIGVGFMFSVRTHFFQITGLKVWLPQTFGRLIGGGARKSRDKGSISQFSALSASLAACMGTGNIVGVAAAMSAGGPGAVFWMTASAVPGMMTACAENTLGVLYRYRNRKNEWVGGSMAYIEKSFGSKAPAVIFSVLCVFSSLGIGNMTQSNALAESMKAEFGISPLVSGAVTAALLGIVIVGGFGRTVKFTEKLVPPMSALFIIGCIAVIAVNCRALPAAVKLIMTEAFSLRAVSGGAVGFGMAKAVRYGVARGVFSNEAGLGTTPIIHASADADEPAVQGMWGIAEVFIDTVLMCSLTGLALLVSGTWTPEIGAAAANPAAFACVFGRAGSVFVSLSTAAFAFATLAGWSCCGTKAAEYAFGERSLPVYKLLCVLAVLPGAAMRLETVWELSDIMNVLMAVPNLISITVMSGDAVREIKKYAPQKRRVKLMRFYSHP